MWSRWRFAKHVREHGRIGSRHDPRFQVVDHGFDLIQQQQIPVDDPVDDPVEQKVRAALQQHRVPRGAPSHLPDHGGGTVVHGDQVVLPEKKVMFHRGHGSGRGVVSGLVEHGEQVAAVVIELGQLVGDPAVLHREGVEAEHGFKQTEFLLGRVLEVEPERRAGLDQTGDGFGLKWSRFDVAVADDEEGQHRVTPRIRTPDLPIMPPLSWPSGFLRSLSTNGHLRRCRCASAPHVPTTYAPVRCSRRLASDAFLTRLQHTNTQTDS
jgi:hypothetical protein